MREEVEEDAYLRDTKLSSNIFDVGSMVFYFRPKVVREMVLEFLGIPSVFRIDFR